MAYTQIMGQNDHSHSSNEIPSSLYIQDCVHIYENIFHQILLILIKMDSDVLFASTKLFIP